MKKSETIQIIREIIEKSILIQNFNPKDIYDFGGAEDPLPGTTVVDIEDKDEEDKDFKEKWIVAISNN